jgi:lipoprotein-anchoring transpeptidase ErfK/SrfK
MRPLRTDTSRPPLKRARCATMAAAVGLALVLGGTAQAEAGEMVKAGGAAVAGKAAVAQPVAGVAPPASVTASRHRVGVHVDINLSRQRATYYRNGKRVATFRVSSGKRGWRTPTGNFRVRRKIAGWRRSRLGLMWRPAYFYGGYAIHGSRSVPGYPASHGCVRVTMSRMAWLYPKLPIGATVRVHY